VPPRPYPLPSRSQPTSFLPRKPARGPSDVYERERALRESAAARTPDLRVWTCGPVEERACRGLFRTAFEPVARSSQPPSFREQSRSIAHV